MAEQLLTTAQVADRLGVSEQHVRRLSTAGELTTVDVSLPGARQRRVKLRFPESSVAELIARRTK